MTNEISVDEQQRLEAQRSRAQALLVGVGDIGPACAVMIAARRMYSVAQGRLNEALAIEPDAQALEDYITGAAKQEAERAFDVSELFDAAAGAVVPWLMREVVKGVTDAALAHAATQAEQAQKPTIYTGEGE